MLKLNAPAIAKKLISFAKGLPQGPSPGLHCRFKTGPQLDSKFRGGICLPCLTLATALLITALYSGPKFGGWGGGEGGGQGGWGWRHLPSLPDGSYGPGY